MKRVNANYEIINSMVLENSFGNPVEIVMGYNEKAPSPYVTWEGRPGDENSFTSGHYFNSKEAALTDFFERGLIETEINLRDKYRDEDALSDIKNALEWNFSKENVNELLDNKSFVEKALRIYYEMDHSRENEALQEALEDLYEKNISETEKVENKKYELTDTYTEMNGEIPLYQIRALKDFGDVKAGDLGGYIEHEDNLSHEGNAWVYDEAFVFDNATVKNSAAVKGNAWIYGSATVQDEAVVKDEAEVCQFAVVKNKAIVCDNALVDGNKVIGGCEIVETKLPLTEQMKVAENEKKEPDKDIAAKEAER